MRKYLIIGTVIVFVVVAASGLYAIYNIQSAPKPITATIKPLPSFSGTPMADKRVSSGNFNKIDEVHRGSGQAVVYETSRGPILKFENFSVTPGPDVFVYLSKNQQGQANKDLGEYVSLGHLQKNDGDQIYALPEDYRDYHSVFVYCRAFKVPFTIADLRS